MLCLPAMKRTNTHDARVPGSRESFKRNDEQLWGCKKGGLLEERESRRAVREVGGECDHL